MGGELVALVYFLWREWVVSDSAWSRKDVVLFCLALAKSAQEKLADRRDEIASREAALSGVAEWNQ